MDDETNGTAHGDSGQRCGAYELVRELKRGGTGSVWEGRHVTLGRRVAVKVLHAEFAGNAELMARLEREGQAAARIKHPNVAQMLDVGHDDTRLWLVMELLDGEDLDALLEREAPLAPTRAVDLMLPVISAVASAHKVGVVHRDLKPGNVFLARDANGTITPKVVDFGFSKIRVEGREDEGLTRAETSLGTLSYMPMEQLFAASDALPASDQYALAVTLYRCVTGRLPFPGRNRYETFNAMTAGTFPRPIEVMPTLPAALDEVIMKALQRTPDGRHASMRDFGVALLPFASPVMQARWGRAFGVAPTPSRASVPPAGPSVPPPRPSTAPRPSVPPSRASTPPPRPPASPLRANTLPPPRPPAWPRTSVAPAPARVTTSSRPSVAPPRVTTSSRSSVPPPRVTTSSRPSVSPPRVTTSSRPSVAPPRVTTSSRPGVAPAKVATAPRATVPPPLPASLAAPAPRRWLSHAQALFIAVPAVMVLAVLLLVLALR